MQVKVHVAYRKIVAVCDSDIIGKTFSEGNKQIEVRDAFFRGEEKNKEDMIKFLKDQEKEDATFNIVGKESVDCAIIAGIISKDGIMTIDNVPVALVLM
jgi:uncharacterized protein